MRYLMAAGLAAFLIGCSSSETPKEQPKPAENPGATDDSAAPSAEEKKKTEEAIAKLSREDDGRLLHAKDPGKRTHAYDWLEVILEASARDVDRVGARPTILSRQMAIPTTAMYDAWAAYDKKAVGTRLGAKLRRPDGEHTEANMRIAIAYAAYRTLLYCFPDDHPWITDQMKKLGHDPADSSEDVTTPQGIGNVVAKELIAYRSNDGSNWNGKQAGSNGEAYSDYTGYKPVNPPGKVVDPDRWGPLPFSDGKGGTFYPGFLTAHWYKVKPFALETAEQFRPGPPPKVGDPQLKKEVEQLIEFNASLSTEQKAIVEFMRDGPRSTAQSGHWLRFAMDASRRDNNDLGTDVKLFFAIGNMAMDAFIASWESKRYYDSSRPWHLVRHYFKGKKILGWRGPGKGVGEIDGSDWIPYSPATFLTPPFPGYTSGHSTVSSACARMLALFTGNDQFGFKEVREAGALTEAGYSCFEIQKIKGKVPPGTPDTCVANLDLPTFPAVAEMAGISRVMGGYHIQADNIAGLELGKKCADYSWPVYQTYFDGTAKIRD